MRKNIFLITIVALILISFSACGNEDVSNEKFVQYEFVEEESEGTNYNSYYFYYNVEELGYPSEDEVNIFMNDIFTLHSDEAKEEVLEVYINDNTEKLGTKANIAKGSKSGDDAYIDYVFEENYNANK